MVDKDKFGRSIVMAVTNGEFAGFCVSALNYLKWYNGIIKSREFGKRDKPASVREMRQWILDGAVAFRNANDYEWSIVTDPTVMLRLPTQAVLFPKKWKIVLPVLEFNVEVKELNPHKVLETI